MGFSTIKEKITTYNEDRETKNKIVSSGYNPLKAACSLFLSFFLTIFLP